MSIEKMKRQFTSFMGDLQKVGGHFCALQHQCTLHINTAWKKLTPTSSSLGAFNVRLVSLWFKCEFHFITFNLFKAEWKADDFPCWLHSISLLFWVQLLQVNLHRIYNNLTDCAQTEYFVHITYLLCVCVCERVCEREGVHVHWIREGAVKTVKSHWAKSRFFLLPILLSYCTHVYFI